MPNKDLSIIKSLSRLELDKDKTFEHNRFLDIVDRVSGLFLTADHVRTLYGGTDVWVIDKWNIGSISVHVNPNSNKYFTSVGLNIGRVDIPDNRVAYAIPDYLFTQLTPEILLEAIKKCVYSSDNFLLIYKYKIREVMIEAIKDIENMV